MQRLHPKFHLYIEANQHQQNSEQRYFSELNRQFKHINIDPNLSLSELKKKAKMSKKKKYQDQFKLDHFAAIIDGDIDYNNYEKSADARIKEISKICNDADISIYLSNRHWENWIVLHYQYFQKFTDNNTMLPIPNYEKTKKWYRTHKDTLFDKMEKAIKNSKNLREVQYLNNNYNDTDLNLLPAYQNKSDIKKILDLNPITYIDILLDKMIDMEKRF
ncbi:RloB domain-containing protein [Gracilibacillus massiliensis]|uniref:RloB domain-containing protein n=1 Tax=Gracilibacillus massiliensis TaxID=1564956 RepID=UPI00071DCFDF|nr:RloB domain-containing protein [Gracilibacillus massiliensis]